MSKRKLFMPMHLQFFAEGEGEAPVISDLDALDAILEGTPPVDEPPADVPPVDEPPADEPPVNEPAKPQKPNQQEFAFAQMRTQMNAYKGMLGKIAQGLGIEYKDETDLINKLNDDALAKLAKAQNVPIEMLKRLETLEQRDQAYTAEKLQANAAVGFQNLKTNYTLSEEELMAFAKELDTDGKNPFLREVDLEAEYKLRHFEDITSKKIAAAVEAALKKQSAATTHSTKPNTAGGRQDGDNVEKITTVAGLSQLLDGK